MRADFRLIRVDDLRGQIDANYASGKFWPSCVITRITQRDLLLRDDPQPLGLTARHHEQLRWHCAHFGF